MSVRDLVELTKPRITIMVVATGLVGVAMAPGSLAPARALAWLLGMTLLVGGANALNMWWERDTDAKMERTRHRPLPAGRLQPRNALLFGLGLSGLATALLSSCNLLTGLLGLLSSVVYVLVYTPLKRRTPYALHCGAVAGAMPPLLGWTALTNAVDGPGLVLFAILFLWQLPHFVAIAMFRADEYAEAGLRVGQVGRRARLLLAGYVLPVVAASLLPILLGMAGDRYLACSLLLGLAFVGFGAIGLRASADARWARSVFGYSMLYLVGLFVVLVADRV